MSKTTFAAIQDDPKCQTVVLVEIEPYFEPASWDKTSGKTNVYETSFSFAFDGSDKKISRVREDDSAFYTEVATRELCDITASSFYYDTTANLIYVHTSTGADPSTFTITVYIWFYFSTVTKKPFTQSVGQNPVYYLPFVNTMGTITRDAGTPVAPGADTFTIGDLTLCNGADEDGAGFFDSIFYDYIWEGAAERLLIGGEALPYSEYKLDGTYCISGLEKNRQDVRLMLTDNRDFMKQNLSAAVFDTTTYPYLETGKSGEKIPVAYGHGFDFEPTCISTQVKTYKPLNHRGIILAAYDSNEGIHVNVGFTVDNDDGEFTLLATPVGQLTCDLIGHVGANKLTDASFEDNLITDWTNGDEPYWAFTTFTTSGRQIIKLENVGSYYGIAYSNQITFVAGHTYKMEFNNTGTLGDIFTATRADYSTQTGGLARETVVSAGWNTITFTADGTENCISYFIDGGAIGSIADIVLIDTTAGAWTDNVNGSGSSIRTTSTATQYIDGEIGQKITKVSGAYEVSKYQNTSALDAATWYRVAFYGKTDGSTGAMVCMEIYDATAGKYLQTDRSWGASQAWCLTITESTGMVGETILFKSAGANAVRVKFGVPSTVSGACVCYADLIIVAQAYELPGTVVKHIFDTYIPLGNTLYDSANLTALDTACPYPLGFIVDKAATFDDICKEKIDLSAFSHHGFSRAGLFQVIPWEAPDIGDADQDYDKFSYISMKEETSIDAIRWKVRVGYGLQIKSAKWQYAEASDDTVKYLYRTAQEETYDTALVYEADAQAVAEKYIAVLKVHRLLVTLRSRLKPLYSDLGDVITLTLSRFNKGTKTALLITRIEEDYETKEIVMRLMS